MSGTRKQAECNGLSDCLQWFPATSLCGIAPLAHGSQPAPDEEKTPTATRELEYGEKNNASLDAAIHGSHAVSIKDD